MGQKPVNGWTMPVFFSLALLAPLGFGTFRAIEIITVGDWRPVFVADHVDRLPLFLHVTGAGLFMLLAVLQILPGTRARHPRWHRKAGKFAFAFGLVGAVSGLWLTLAHPGISGPILYWGRAIASAAWFIFLLLAVGAIKRRDFRAHGRWMIRAFALALPAGTLAFILFPMVLILGEDGHDLFFEIVQVLAWVGHLGVAEWLIRRRLPRALPAPLKGAIA